MNGQPAGSVLLKLGLPLATVGSAFSSSTTSSTAGGRGGGGGGAGGESFHGQLAGFRCVLHTYNKIESRARPPYSSRVQPPHFPLDSYWSHARTPAEIQRDLNREAHPQEAGLLGSWALREGEGAGARVHDATGTFRKCLQRHCRWEVRDATRDAGRREGGLVRCGFRVAWVGVGWFLNPSSHQPD